MPSRTSVILPTYNERGHIVLLVSAVLTALPDDTEILVVDDNSPDGTLDAVREAYGNEPRVIPILRTEDRGLARSILDGLRRSSGNVIVVMDTDFSHDAALLPIMLDNIRYFDFVSGSRYVYGGGMYSPSRYLLSYLFNLLTRFVLGTRLSDNLSGFFAARRDFLERIVTPVGWDKVFTGYGGYYITLCYLAVKSGGRILEIPSWYDERTYGESKTKFLKTCLTYLGKVLSLRWREGKAWRTKDAVAGKRPGNPVKSCISRPPGWNEFTGGSGFEG